MAGNIFSRALLSIFMDKSARQKLDAINEAKSGKTKKGTKKSASPNKGTTDLADDVLPDTLIKQAIGQAEQELDRKKRLPPDRQALIEQALSIHDQQSKILDELPKEQREKLMVMALHAFGELDDQGAPKTPEKKAKRKKP
jgi:hypothetical protein